MSQITGGMIDFSQNSLYSKHPLRILQSSLANSLLSRRPRHSLQPHVLEVCRFLDANLLCPTEVPLYQLNYRSS